MFHLIFDAVLAYMQLMYLVAGSACSGIGLLVVGYAAYLHVHEHVYAAEVVGVRKEDGSQAMFWPVIAYVDEKGQRHEGLANSGSSLIGGRTPGSKTMILADPASPASPMLMRDWWFLVAAGTVVSVVGYPFIHFGLKNLHFNWTTLFVAVAISVCLAIRIFRFVHPLLDARKSNGLPARQATEPRRAAARERGRHRHNENPADEMAHVGIAISGRSGDCIVNRRWDLVGARLDFPLAGTRQ